MSVEEDNELRDLVSQTLETKGVLTKIRAELRASVFLALEEQDAFKDKNNMFVNKALKDFVSMPEGLLAVNLVREFLEYFGLEFTSSVFEPETQAGKDYKYIGRTKLAQELKLSTVKKAPLLVQLVQDGRTSNPVTNITKDVETDNNVTRNETVRNRDDKQDRKLTTTTNNNNNSSFNNNNINNSSNNATLRAENNFIQSVLNGQIKAMEKDNLKEVPSTESKPLVVLNSPQQTSVQNPVRKPDSLKLDLTQPGFKPSGGSLTSLGNLPPLGAVTTSQPIKQNKSSRHNKEVSNDIKALLDFDTDTQDQNYEEDFHSSASDKTKPGDKTNHSPSGSGSEIDEEILSVADDLLNSSISGGVDDNTGELSGASNNGEGIVNL